MQLKVVKGGKNVTISYEQPVKPYHSLVARLVGEYSAGMDSVSVLDVGCGTGNTLVEIERVGVDARFTVADVDPNCLEIVQRRLKVHRAYVVDNSDVLGGLNDERYQFILYSHVLQYEEQPKKVVTNLLGMLAHDGYLVVAISNVATLPKFLNSSFRRQYSEGIVTWDKSTFTNLLKAVPKCRVVSWHYDYVPLPLVGSSRIGIIVGRVLAKIFPNLCFSFVAVLKSD